MSMKVTRRRALTIIGGALLAAATYLMLSWPFKKEEKKVLPPREGRKNPYISNGRPVVVVAEGGDGSELVDRAIERLGGLDKLVRSGDTVVVKPNVGFPYPEATVSPEVVAEVVRLALDAGAAEVIVAESAVRGSDTNYCVDRTGIREVAEKAGAKVIDLKREGSRVWIRLPDPSLLGEVEVYREVYEADVLVSVAKMKRHVDATVTLGMKNLIGAFPDMWKGYFHNKGINRAIAEITAMLKPDLVVIDGTEAMLEQGPAGGKMVELGIVVASGDPVAADTVGASRIFEAEGVDEPWSIAVKVPHIVDAVKLELGVSAEDEMELVKV